MRLLSSMILTTGLLGAVAPSAKAGEGPRADLAGGYSLIYDHDIRTTFPAGWFFSAAVNATSAFAVAAEMSGHYNSPLKVHTLLAGPRFVAGTGAARLFGEILAGAAIVSAGVTTTGSAATEFCYMPAVGLDIGFNPKTAMRIGAGERLIRVAGGSTSKEFHFVAGLVHRFEK